MAHDRSPPAPARALALRPDAAHLRRVRLGLLLLNGLAVLACAGMLHGRWQDEMRESELQTRHAAAQLARSADATLENVALSLAAVSDRIEEARRGGGLDAASIWPMVDLVTARVPAIQTIGLFDREGRQICGIPESRCRHLDIADRDYFAALRTRAGPELLLAGPMVSRFDGQTVLILARGMTAADGSFGGVASALLPLGRLAPLLEAAPLGPHGAASLRLARQLELLVRTPAVPPSLDATVTQALSTQMNAALQVDAASGVFRARLIIDGLERVYAYRKLEHFAAYAFVGNATEDFLAGWRWSLWWTGGFLLVIAAASVALERLSTANHRRQLLARQLYDEAPCAYHTLGPEGLYLDINVTELHWLGCTRDEVVGRLGPRDFADDEARATFAARFPRITQGESVEALEFNLTGRDGTQRRVVVNAVPVLDRQGRFICSNSVMHDITALHQAQLALQRRHAEQQAMLDTELIGLITLEDGRVSWANAGMGRIFGYGRHEWTGMPVARLQGDGVELPRFDPARPDASPVREQVQMRRRDGAPVWIDAFGVQLPGRGAFFILSDITPIKRAEELRVRGAELEAENRGLRESTRLKDEFLANMSHELRTPLNAVIGFAELLRRQAATLDETRRDTYLRQIGDSGRHLLDLVQATLDVVQAEAGRLRFKPEPVPVRAALTEVVDMLLARQQSAQVGVEIHVDPQLDTVVADALRLRQMVLNLVDNALKFSPPGGRIDVRARVLDEARWTVEVEDHGIGIAAADLERLFQRFVQVSTGNTRSHGGTGLGLALVRHIARAQGGDVTARSAPGSGSVFTLVLPRVLPAGEA